MNGLVLQWIREFKTNDGNNWLTLPIAMESVNYIIVDGRQGTNLEDVTGWAEKQTTRFRVNPVDGHTTDFFIIG